MGGEIVGWKQKEKDIKKEKRGIRLIEVGIESGVELQGTKKIELRIEGLKEKVLDGDVGVILIFFFLLNWTGATPNDGWKVGEIRGIDTHTHTCINVCITV